MQFSGSNGWLWLIFWYTLIHFWFVWKRWGASWFHHHFPWFLVKSMCTSRVPRTPVPPTEAGTGDQLMDLDECLWMFDPLKVSQQKIIVFWFVSILWLILLYNCSITTPSCINWYGFVWRVWQNSHSIHWLVYGRSRRSPFSEAVYLNWGHRLRTAALRASTARSRSVVPICWCPAALKVSWGCHTWHRLLRSVLRWFLWM